MRRPGSMARLARNHALLGLISANGLSAVGDWLYLTALPVFVFRETGDVALVGLVAAGRLLPWLILSMPAGVLADRYPRARVLVIAESARATQMLLMTALCVAGAPWGAVLLLALGAVVAGTFAMPAQTGLVPQLARDDAELGLGNALSAGLDNLACVIGPAIAGLLILVGGLELAFALNGLSFLIVVVVLLLLVPRSAPIVSAAPETDPDAADTDGAFGSWPTIARAAARPLALDAGISFASGALSVLPILVVVEVLRAGDAAVGAIGVAAGVAGIVGAAVAGVALGTHVRIGIALGTVVTAASLVVIPIGASLVTATLGMAAGTAGIVLLDTLNTTVLQRTTPRERLGRTFGLLNTLASAWVMAGCVVPAAVASVAGIQAAVLVPAVGIAALATLSAVQRPHRRMAPPKALPATAT